MALTGLTQLQPTNINVTGIATFEQTVGIAGTLTYEDVANVDAVGLITARSGVSVSGGQVSVGAGTSLHSTGLDLGTGNITGHNLKSTGIITATSFSGSGANLTGVLKNIVEDTSPQLGGNLDCNDHNIHLDDNHYLYLGDTQDASLFNTGTYVFLKNYSGAVAIQATTEVNLQKFNNADIGLKYIVDGAVELYHDNVKVIETNTTGIQVGFDGVSNPTIKLPDNGYLTWGTSDVAYIQGADAGSGAYLMFNANNTQRMKIHDDGSIIIGSTSKSSTAGAGGLDIQGNSTNCVLEMGNPFPNVSGGVNPEFRITATNSNHTVHFESVWGGTNQLYKHLAFAGGATMIYDGTSNTEVGRFTGEGLVVGSTTFSNAHNTDPGACVFENGQVMCRRDNTMFTAKSIATGGQNAFRVLSAQTQVGSIYFNSGGTSFNTSSDYRRKENVIDLTGAITRLKTLKPKRFNFISNPAVTLDGFLAHEVTAVPEAVTGIKDEVATEDGEDYKKGDPIYQQLDQSKIVPLLVAALQEAVARIEALEGS